MYPTLQRVIGIVILDNGMLHRGSDSFEFQIAQRLEQVTDAFAPESIARAEAALFALTEDQLETVSAGEQSEAAALIDEFTANVIDAAFSDF